jgi:mono/diheme cytochrome c family protein
MAAAVTRFPEGGAPTTSGQIVFAILPLDFAYSRDGKRVAFVFAGNASDVTRRAPQVFLASASDTPGALGSSRGDPGCIFPTPQPPPDEPIEFRPPVGETIAVDFDGQGRVVVQTREPARLEILSHRGGTIKLSDTSRFDSGQAVFHMATVNGLACASCHPEGGDDGRIWSFQKLGIRRTQNLRGGIAKTAPFHWDGDMRDLTHLMTEVFTGRMGGPGLTADHVQALGSWMDRLPSVGHTPAGDAAAVARGKLLFEDAKVACATCHAGPQLTNNTTVDVGTGKAFQVPSLRGLSARAPYMHDGCAKTLADRFAGSCGGGDKHGVTSQLTPAQITDLVSYLETL